MGGAGLLHGFDSVTPLHHTPPLFQTDQEMGKSKTVRIVRRQVPMRRAGEASRFNRPTSQHLPAQQTCERNEHAANHPIQPDGRRRGSSELTPNCRSCCSANASAALPGKTAGMERVSADVASGERLCGGSCNSSCCCSRARNFLSQPSEMHLGDSEKVRDWDILLLLRITSSLVGLVPRAAVRVMLRRGNR